MKYCVIIIVVIIFILFFNIEPFVQQLQTTIDSNYQKYINGEIVEPIFSKKIIEKINNNQLENLHLDMIDLYNLMKIISNLEGFDMLIVNKLVTPLKRNFTEVKWGIFTSLNPNIALQELEYHPKLNSKQLLSVKKYNADNRLKNRIKKIVNLKKIGIYNCVDLIKDFLSKELGKNNIKLNVKNDFDLVLDKYSQKELKIIQQIFEWLPNNPCMLIKSIMEIEKLRNMKNFEVLSDCSDKLNKYLTDLYRKHNISYNKNIMDYDLKNHSLDELVIINNLYKYLLSCDNLSSDNLSSDKLFNINKNLYIENLIKNIESYKLSLPQIKDCPKKVSKYLKDNYEIHGISRVNISDFPKDDISKFSENHLEMINELYREMPNCDKFLKDELINKILEFQKNIKLISGGAYGCLNSIIVYLNEEFKKNTINLSVQNLDNLTKKIYSKFSLIELEHIFKIFIDIPGCKDLDINLNYNFDDKMDNYYKNLESSKEIIFNSSKKFNNINQNNKYLVTKDLQPYSMYKTDVISEDDNFFTHNDILNETKMNLDSYFEDNLFSKEKCKPKVIYKTKYISKKTDKSNKICNKNDSIIQHKSEGTSSIYAPNLTIKIPSNYKINTDI